MRTRIVAIAISSFVAGMVLGIGGLAYAQSSNDGFKIFKPAPAPTTVTTVKEPQTAEVPVTLRVSGRRDGRVVGKLVVNVNGKLMEVQLAPQDSFLK